ncbi:helix-turn-helix domain-containing protein [Staphylococcus carnosus]|uniref:helix-turn-helix domain-containing protein n=1 Tax=Staphylococcus carnosus TaxID=1281 RepID=UPI00067FF303|nr:helix-turn-helix transcriptional regulator [Staphylococcus carnosus]QPT03556.1 helix-turn-helix transcriptional regulator [Staphylococcus carnosus]UQA66279.1 helix-turn-helix domain-containing protein [Staphylococcus carnosus]UTB78882.1 hypothetical protein A2I62_10075 [Staphylococcus carnosus]UTB86091.1 hypothetical protein A2I66_10565 [Staphylococcus carnosus]UTB88435.1 hypothetical protein A2I63_10075 [Staphylococcus carnosus]
MFIKDEHGKPIVLPLANWRKMKGLTQKSLAKQAEVTERTIQNYEDDTKNIRNARYSTIKRIAEALGIGTDNIFFD